MPIRKGIGAGLWLRLNLATERNWSSGNHEIAVQEHLREVVYPKAVFYDIGAHLGFFSLAAARLGARVVAMEADPENAERLRAHAEKNSLVERIQIVEAAAWSNGGETVTFRRGEPRSQGGVVDRHLRPVLATGETIEVARTSIDDYVDRGGPVPDILKVDVEGGEVEVLYGAARTLHNFRPKLIVEVHHAQAFGAIQELLLGHRYSTRWLTPPEDFPRQCFASAEGV